MFNKAYLVLTEDLERLKEGTLYKLYPNGKVLRYVKGSLQREDKLRLGELIIPNGYRIMSREKALSQIEDLTVKVILWHNDSV